MANEITLKKELVTLKTEKAIKLSYFKECNLNLIIDWLNENTNNYIGFFTNDKDLDMFMSYANEINNISEYKVIINTFKDILNDTEKYFYWYDFANDEINIMEKNDKHNGLIDIVLYYTNQISVVYSYYEFLNDLDI